MKQKKRAGLALALALALTAGAAAPASAAVKQDAEKALEAQPAPASQQLKDTAEKLAHSTVALTGLDMAQDAAITSERMKKLVPELAKASVDVQKLSRELALYNDGSALRLHVRFRPDGAGYRALVEARRDQADHVGISFDNNGSKYTGDARATVVYQNTDLTGAGDRLGVALVTSPGHFDQVKQAALSYRWLLPHAADAMTFSASHSRVKLEDLAEGYPFDIASSGKSTRLGLDYDHYFHHSARQTDYLAIGVTHHKSESDTDLSIPGYRTSIGHYDFSHTDALLGYYRRMQGSFYRFSYHVGAQVNVAGDKKDFQQMTGGSDDRYLIWQGDVDYLRRLPGNWLLRTRVSGQYTNDVLIGCEKYGAGGRDSVRGFDENIRTADNGLGGTIEFYTPEYAPGLRLLAFADGALLRDHAEGVENVRLASAGLGLRYQRENYALAVDYAKVLDEPESVKKGDAGHRLWNVRGSIYF